MSWFDKKKTTDGTNIIHHKPANTQVGTIPEAVDFRRRREEIYQQLFKESPVSVSHEVMPLVPHIDVYTFKRSFKSPKGDQVVYALVTGGMSDLKMLLPQRADKEAPRRVELIFYCAEPREEYIETLRWVAHFPHDNKTWLGHGHTMPNGNPPCAFWGSTEMDTLFFMPPIVIIDQSLPEKLQLASDPVHFLWVVPLTTPECKYKLKNGFDAMLDLFGQHKHPHVFDPQRKSYV